MSDEGMVLRNVPRFARQETSRTLRRGKESRSDPRAASRGRPAHGFAARMAASRIFRRMELERWLVERHRLHPAQARGAADRLLASAPALRGAFRRWWLTGRVDEVEVGGFSLRRLVEEKGMSVLGALLALSLLASGRAEGRELEGRPAGKIDLDEAMRRLDASDSS